jgi:Mg2+ and Co2+ transporter CorA
VDRALDDLNELPRLLEEWSVVWLDVAGLGDADTISEIGRVLGLHELSLEDVVNVHQRPKVEEYDEYGYPFAMGLMAAIAVALLILFRVRGWLRADDLRPRRGRERP